MARARTILIAGAGIGGLAAAIALAREGYRPLILERAEKLEEAGAGIQLTPNAVQALDRLGVLGTVRARAVAAGALVVACGETGRELARVPLQGAERRFGAPWLVTLRADLQRALLSAAEDIVDIEFAYGAEVNDFAIHARGVTALTTQKGRSEEQLGIALVGADGLWSSVRARLHGNTQPQFSGLVAWRALVPARALPAAYAEPLVRLWLGPDAHVVHYPVAGGETINVVGIFHSDWQDRGWSAPAGIADLPRTCDHWAEMPQQALAAARSFQRWALADRDPLTSWGDGCVTLLGDAAHPMLPTLAQGAGAALEDAVVLARRMKKTGDVAQAMRDYEIERMPRTARMQQGARFNARMYHASGPLRWARDLKLRWDAERLIDRHAWIYGYRPG